MTRLLQAFPAVPKDVSRGRCHRDCTVHGQVRAGHTCMCQACLASLPGLLPQAALAQDPAGPAPAGDQRHLEGFTRLCTAAIMRHCPQAIGTHRHKRGSICKIRAACGHCVTSAAAFNKTVDWQTLLKAVFLTSVGVAVKVAPADPYAREPSVTLDPFLGLCSALICARVSTDSSAAYLVLPPQRRLCLTSAVSVIP